MFYFYIFLFVLIIIYLYWRFLFFYRNPERKIPSGNNIVSPADGTVVYVKKIEGSSVPLSIKNKKVIKLDEIFKLGNNIDYLYEK